MNKSHLIFTGSYKNDIHTLKFDPLSNSLQLISTTTVGYRPSWITFHPHDHSLVFAVLEQSDGKVITVNYNKEGKGNVVGEVPSGGQDPCSLFATANELAVANVRPPLFSHLEAHLGSSRTRNSIRLVQWEYTPSHPRHHILPKTTQRSPN